MERPDCYKCIYRRPLAGNAHSGCKHPKTSSAHKHPMAELLALLGGGGFPMVGDCGLGIEAHPHGVASGWFAWPFNYDPVWLRACNGFEPAASQPKEEE